MSSGVYYSKLEGSAKYRWSFMIPSEENPAHFGGRDIVNVISLYLTSGIRIRDWSYHESESKFCVLPERVLKW